MQKWKPILLVEDDSLDTMTLRRACKDGGVMGSLVCSTNGEEALEYLRNEGNEKPCIILLDLNMPKMNGIEFLKVAKADEALKEIPVIVLTTSTEERDVAESFKLGVAGYIIKPCDYGQFVEMIRAIDKYWTLSKLPIGK